MSEDEKVIGLNKPTNESLQRAGAYLAKFISGPPQRFQTSLMIICGTFV
jgi:hypothetical protein